MHLIVLANDDKQKAALLSKKTNKNVIIDFVNDYGELLSHKNADALFILQDKINVKELQSINTQIVFIHSVTFTLNDLEVNENVCRINAWPTFVDRDIMEVATKNEATVKSISDNTGWNFLVLPDEPGFVAARVIAMIINEAYYTFEDGVSTKDEIDVSLRLGANYPYGPFEWAQIIGLKNVYDLLKRLQQNNSRYTISSAMENEVKNSDE